jgi:hypothetical protein
MIMWRTRLMVSSRSLGADYLPGMEAELEDVGDVVTRFSSW